MTRGEAAPVRRRGPANGRRPTIPTCACCCGGGLLAIFLTGSSIFVHYLGTERIAGPGLIGALGLLYTSLAVGLGGPGRPGRRVRPLLAAQLAADMLCLGLLVQFSGGPFSAFPLLFCVPIMLAAQLPGRPRGPGRRRRRGRLHRGRPLRPGPGLVWPRAATRAWTTCRAGPCW